MPSFKLRSQGLNDYQMANILKTSRNLFTRLRPHVPRMADDDLEQVLTDELRRHEFRDTQTTMPAAVAGLAGVVLGICVAVLLV